jgi:PAS domain S-box-containing protein
MPRNGSRVAQHDPAIYEVVVEAAPTAMVMVDEAGRILLVNEAAERLFGYRRDELVGRPIEMLVPDRFRTRHPGDRADFLREPVARPMGAGRDLFALRKDGTEVPVEIGLNPVVTGDQVFVLSAIVDITERRRAEERFRLAVEAAPNAMLMADPAGRIVLVNSQAERLFGYARSELVGRQVELLVPERLRDAHPRYRAGFVAAPQTRSMGAGRDLFAVRKDGSEVPVEIGLNPIVMSDGTYVLSSVIDITERKRAETERDELLERERAALAEARAASRAKDEFLAVLSHELRTPLNAILGWASLLRAGGFGADETEMALETIERNAKLQTRIVSEILDVSRIVRGKFQLEMARCDPASVVESAMNSLRPAARAKRITLRSSLAPVREVVADPARIEQVVWNLVSNAIKFTDKGGTVDVALSDQGSHLRIDVADTGRGIPQSFLPRVFDRFTQADSSSTREHGGLGLGLAIARHLVELHGGAIEVESEGEAKGARFTVRLPVAPPEEVHAADRERTSVASQDAPRLDDLRILIVDDEPDARTVLAVSLSCYGANVATAGSVSEAIELLASFRPDIVVSDIAMPGEDGFELLRHVREDRVPGTSRIPVVAVTAYAGADDRRAMLEAGFRMHVPKPVEPAQLVSMIAQVARDAGQKLH